MTHQTGKFKKIPFSKIQFLTFTLSPNLLYTDLLETSVRARRNKICRRKEKDGGKGWYLPTFGNFLYERRSSRKAKSQPSRMFGQKFLHYKSFLCCQLFWGPGQVIYPCYLTFSISIMRTKTLVYVIRFL